MDQTQTSPDGGQPSGSESQQPSDAVPAASPLAMQTSNEHDDFQEDALLADEAAGWSAQFVIPFQQSGQLPAVNPQTARAPTNQTGTLTQGRATPRRFPILKVGLISTVIVLAVGFLALSVFAQPASHLTTLSKHPTQGSPAKHTTVASKTARPIQRTPTPTIGTATPQATPQNNWVPSAQMLQQLGWMGAGLSTGDALEAERTCIGYLAHPFVNRPFGLSSQPLSLCQVGLSHRLRMGIVLVHMRKHGVWTATIREGIPWLYERPAKDLFRHDAPSLIAQGHPAGRSHTWSPLQAAQW